MKVMTGIAVLAAAVVASGAGAAQVSVAKGPGLVVSLGGGIYLNGKQIANGSQPTWSPNGKQVAFHRNGEIFVIDADGKNERRLTSRKPGLHWPASFPAWSRDGRLIAFSGTR